MNNLKSWIERNTDNVVLVLNVIIILVASIVVALQIIKAIKAAGKNSYSEIGKIVGSIIIVVILAALGVAGAVALGNAIKPEELTYSNNF